jgi:hypothetical protein
VPADERHEVGKGQGPRGVEPVAGPLEEDDVLVAAPPDRLDEAAAQSELLRERRRNPRERGGDEDAFERPLLGQARLPSPTDSRCRSRARA